MPDRAQRRLHLACERTISGGEYDAKTGVVINANLITGLGFPFGIGVCRGESEDSCQVMIAVTVWIDA